MSIDTIRTCSFSSISSVQNCPQDLVCCAQEAVEQAGVGGERGHILAQEDIEMLIATGTSRGTAGISECPPFFGQLIFLLCLSVYAQGRVFVAEVCGWRQVLAYGNEGVGRAGGFPRRHLHGDAHGRE